jgi:hypothetical protein
MNAERYEGWFANRFVNDLEEGSIIIMDSVSYHSIIDEVPNAESSKRVFKSGCERIVMNMTQQNYFALHHTDVENRHMIRNR